MNNSIKRLQGYCNISTKELLYRFLYFIQVASTQILSAEHNADRIQYVHTIFVTANFLTAELILPFSKHVTQVWLAWRQAEPFCPSADWLSLLPSSAWLKLYLRAFSWAKFSRRSCLTAWPRCSLLGQLQPEILSLLGPLHGAWHTWQSQWILSSVGWAWILSSVGWAWILS